MNNLSNKSLKEILLENFFPQQELRTRTKLELLGFLFNNNCFYCSFSKNDFLVPIYFKKNLLVNIKKHSVVFTILKFKNSEKKNSYLRGCDRIKLFIDEILTENLLSSIIRKR